MTSSNQSHLKFLGHARLEADILVLSGLHIGAGKDTIEIGGIDNGVIKHPHTLDPYIPGSSLKGKLRFLLEWAFGQVRADGKPWGFDDKDGQTFDASDAIQRIFGTPAKKEKWQGGPTRLICRDAIIDKEWREAILRRGLPLTEDKTEVVIDRIAGKALDGVGTRQTERVPAGAKFKAEFGFRLYDTGDGGARDRQCLAWLIQAFDMLEQDALGGSGSRGYGRVRFESLKLIGFAGAEASTLDNVFRSHPFSKVDPQAEILTAVTAATPSPA